MGVGSAATRAHLPALQALESSGRAEVVGVCDRRADRREAVLQDHPRARGFAENDQMLDEVLPDLLVIATPPSVHLGEMAAAVDRGLHVLCEKPLGLNDDDLGTLRELAASHGDLTLATVQQYRFARPWRWLARAVAGALRENEPFELAITVGRPGTDPLSAGSWRSDPEHEGGIIGDHGAHYLGLLHSLGADVMVTACDRHGSGASEVAGLEATIGAAGHARIELSYSAERRRNVVRLERPSQCLTLSWDGDRATFVHNEDTRDHHPVESLTDRALVNRLYAPMYDELLDGVHVPAWRAAATAQTVGIAALVAASMRLAREQPAQQLSPG